MQETWVGSAGRSKKIAWRREWQPAPVFLPGTSHGQRSLVGCSPWGHKESDTTKCINSNSNNKDDYSLQYLLIEGFPCDSEGKVSACNAGDLGLIPGSGRSPGEGNSNLLWYSCLENPMEGGAW